MLEQEARPKRPKEKEEKTGANQRQGNLAWAEAPLKAQVDGKLQEKPRGPIKQRRGKKEKKELFFDFGFLPILEERTQSSE